MKLVKEHINEKFTPDSDPIKDMNIGKKNQILKDLKEIGINESDVEIADDYTITRAQSYYHASISGKFRDIQLKYMPEEKRIFAEKIIDVLRQQSSYYKTTNKTEDELLEEYIQEAIDNKISIEDIKKLMKEFGNRRLINLSNMIIPKLTRARKEKKYDDEYNIYVFIGFMDKVPVVVSGKKYYEEKFNTETLVKINKFNTSDLKMIEMMEIRARVQYGSVSGCGVYKMHIPKDFMDEDSYFKIPDEYYDLFMKYKQKVL